MGNSVATNVTYFILSMIMIVLKIFGVYPFSWGVLFLPSAIAVVYVIVLMAVCAKTRAPINASCDDDMTSYLMERSNRVNLSFPVGKVLVSVFTLIFYVLLGLRIANVITWGWIPIYAFPIVPSLINYGYILWMTWKTSYPIYARSFPTLGDEPVQGRLCI